MNYSIDIFISGIGPSSYTVRSFLQESPPKKSEEDFSLIIQFFIIMIKIIFYVKIQALTRFHPDEIFLYLHTKFSSR